MADIAPTLSESTEEVAALAMSLSDSATLTHDHELHLEGPRLFFVFLSTFTFLVDFFACTCPCPCPCSRPRLLPFNFTNASFAASPSALSASACCSPALVRGMSFCFLCLDLEFRVFLLDLRSRGECDEGVGGTKQLCFAALAYTGDTNASLQSLVRSEPLPGVRGESIARGESLTRGEPRAARGDPCWGGSSLGDPQPTARGDPGAAR